MQGGSCKVGNQPSVRLGTSGGHCNDDTPALGSQNVFEATVNRPKSINIEEFATKQLNAVNEVGVIK